MCKEIEARIGGGEELSLPCSVHLVSNYNLLAALPNKSSLEFRFATNRAACSAVRNGNIELRQTKQGI